MQKITTFIKEEYPTYEENMEFFSLDEMPNDCPWKCYEKSTSKEFMKINFKPIEEGLVSKKGYFSEKLANKCVEVAFVKLYIEDFKEKRWLTIYLFEESLKDTYSYAVAGFPLVSTLLEALKEKNYPPLLLTFLSVHSFWDYREAHTYGSRVQYNDIDGFDIESLSSHFEFTTSEFVVTYPEFHGKEVVQTFLIDDNHLFEKEDAIYDSISIYGVEDFTGKSDEDEAQEEFIERYLPHGILFQRSCTGDYDFFVKDKNEKMWIYRYCHDGSADNVLYSDYEEYLFRFLNDWKHVEYMTENSFEEKLESFKNLDNLRMKKFIEQVSEKMVVYIHEGDLTIDGDMSFSVNDTFTLLITGDLTVKGTIGIFPWNEVGLIVGGTIRCENFINPNAHLFVGKDLLIEKLGLIQASKRNVEIVGQCKTEYLVSFYGYPEHTEFSHNITGEKYNLFKEKFYSIEDNKVTFNYYVLNTALFNDKDVLLKDDS